jgi:hypothetical protein
MWLSFSSDVFQSVIVARRMFLAVKLPRRIAEQARQGRSERGVLGT